MEIKLLSEVEKIWIIYDVDNSGLLERNEVHDYIKQMAQPSVDLAEKQIDEIYNLIDTDGDGSIDKKEMETFLRILMVTHQKLSFKPSSSYSYQSKKTKPSNFTKTLFTTFDNRFKDHSAGLKKRKFLSSGMSFVHNNA